MKTTNYSKPRYHFECPVCNNKYISDNIVFRIPRYFNKINPRKKGFTEYPCPGSGRMGHRT
jgi:predicted RNA-binding Zn-ribbon protein involved in translation (DUF1610 family)